MLEMAEAQEKKDCMSGWEKCKGWTSVTSPEDLIIEWTCGTRTPNGAGQL